MDIKVEKTRQNESGFYCEDCDCVLKDSASYQDHLNGKKHNKNIGILLKKFTDSTLEEVKEMLAKKKREREEKASGFTYEDQWRAEEERARRIKREKKQRQKARRSGNQVEENSDETDSDKEEEKAEEDEESDAMARLMGFSNFQTSKR